MGRFGNFGHMDLRRFPFNVVSAATEWITAARQNTSPGTPILERAMESTVAPAGFWVDQMMFGVNEHRSPSTRLPAKRRRLSDVDTATTNPSPVEHRTRATIVHGGSVGSDRFPMTNHNHRTSVLRGARRHQVIRLSQQQAQAQQQVQAIRDDLSRIEVPAPLPDDSLYVDDAIMDPGTRRALHRRMGEPYGRGRRMGAPYGTVYLRELATFHDVIMVSSMSFSRVLHL